MRKRMNIVVAGCLIALVAIVWIVARTQRDVAKLAATPQPLLSIPVPQLQPQPQPAQIEIVEVPATTPAALPVAVPPLPGEAINAARPDVAIQHVAQQGETVNSLAGDLLGKDNKANRDAIISANASLQADPDKLVAGKTYQIPSAAQAAGVQVTATAVTQMTDAAPQAKVVVRTAKVLKYTAAPGDTVAKMAAAFLGNDEQTNQDAIINANPSLKADPDHVEVGQSYKIPVPHGLSASDEPVAVTPRPTMQPDADQIVVAGSPKTLRYTARAGDTVSKMAVQLLGSDTKETRDAIISNNPDLKKDPDRVVAGQTYWIPAPSATADVR